jgi:hypothetical protein
MQHRFTLKIKVNIIKVRPEFIYDLFEKIWFHIAPVSCHNTGTRVAFRTLQIAVVG